MLKKLRKWFPTGYGIVIWGPLLIILFITILIFNPSMIGILWFMWCIHPLPLGAFITPWACGI